MAPKKAATTGAAPATTAKKKAPATKKASTAKTKQPELQAVTVDTTNAARMKFTVYNFLAQPKAYYLYVLRSWCSEVLARNERQNIAQTVRMNCRAPMSS